MKNRPHVTPPDGITVTPEEITTLANGVKIYSLNSTDSDVVRFSFIFKAGTSFQDKPFCASSTANLLCEGTENYSSKQISELLDFYGSYYDVSLDRDYTVLNFVSLLKYLPETVRTAREIILLPTFDQNEIEVYCAKRKQRLALERTKIAVRSRELFTAALFGKEHPYGFYYDEKFYDELKRDDIVSFYSSRFTADNCFVVCSGKITTNEIAQIASLAGDLPAGGVTAEPLFPSPSPQHYVFGEQAGALQSSIRTGTLLFPRTHPDFIPAQVASTILGGYFGSRLVRNLREERGYTYGVFSTIVNLKNSGYLAIATEVATAATEDAVRQIFYEIERLRNEPVGDAELDMVKNIMIGEVMRILDGPFGIADVTIENTVSGMDNSYIDHFISEIKHITADKVIDTAKKYFDPRKFSTVVVGDKSLSDLTV